MATFKAIEWRCLMTSAPEQLLSTVIQMLVLSANASLSASAERKIEAAAALSLMSFLSWSLQELYLGALQ